MENQNFLTKCPYDDCDNLLAVSQTVEVGDVLVCRTVAGQEGLTGCNRNVEVKALQKNDNSEVNSAELITLQIDEDWGQ